MTLPYSYQFGTTEFHPVAADGQPLVSAPGLAYSLRHVPYSNLNVLDQGGLTERHFATTIRVDPDKVVETEALLGSTATIRVANVDWSQATLLKLENHRMTPRGEFHLYDAEWVVRG